MFRFKVLLELCLLITVCSAADEGSAQTLQYDFKRTGQAQYQYSFETSNGITREETGDEIPSIHDASNNAAYIKGSFSYPGADGVIYMVNYIADEAGFHPEGDHLKIPPFTPWVPGQPVDDGQYTPDNSGQYKPDNSGRFIPDDSENASPQDNSGRFITPGSPGAFNPPDNSGRFNQQNNRGPFNPRDNADQFSPRDNSGGFLPKDGEDSQSPILQPQQRQQNYISGERVLGPYRTTPQPPMPTTQKYLPTQTPIKTNYVSGERILDTFLSPKAPNPTTKYLPSSTTPVPQTYTSRENILNAFRSVTPTPKYLPSTERPILSQNAIIKEAFFNKPTPHPDILLHSTPNDGSAKFSSSNFPRPFSSASSENNPVYLRTSQDEDKSRFSRGFEYTDINPELRLLAGLIRRK